MSNQSNGAGTKKTFVDEGTQFQGSLTSSCLVEVKGSVEGDITAPALSVSTSGSVRGKVRAAELRSEGELAGEFDCDVVQLAGVVKDNTVIRAKSLEVKLAPEKGKLQVIFGECELEIGDPAAQTTTTIEEAQPASPPSPPLALAAANAGTVVSDGPDTVTDGSAERRSKRKSDKNGSVAPPANAEE
jgi:cytoskeletal protein CcmA (bactofilin family)